MAALLIISDSHGNAPALEAALCWAAQASAFTAAVFLGDGAEDLAGASARAGFTPPWHIVRGNGDLDCTLPESLVLEVPAAAEHIPSARNRADPVRRLFLAHGNRYAVDGGPAVIAAAARSAGAAAALFGHTHIPLCGETAGIFTLNPGSIGRPRSRIGPTFAALDCLPDGPLFSARFYGLVNRGRTAAGPQWAVRELKL